MGNKNRIFLGTITSLILHHHRNRFNNDNMLMVSKKKAKKIKENHPQQAQYIFEYKFQNLLEKTVASCHYKQDGIVNFIANDDGIYILYGISINNYHNELSTIFKPSVRQLIKCQESMKFFSEISQVAFEEYIKN